jgi:hypothetical protein
MSESSRVRVLVPLSRGTVSPEIPPNASSRLRKSLRSRLRKSLHVMSAPVRRRPSQFAELPALAGCGLRCPRRPSHGEEVPHLDLGGLVSDWIVERLAVVDVERVEVLGGVRVDGVPQSL